MGGNNSNQTIEYVRSFDPRSWSCLHLDEGSLACNNATVQNNDIGPCGTDQFRHWADGVSISCRNAIVRNNMIQGPTDGGIVLFGSPGTQVYNNTVWILNVCFIELIREMVLTIFQQTLLGGINMVDYEPWLGDYTGTSVHNNTILGGFANEDFNNGSKGVNAEDAIIKYVFTVIKVSCLDTHCENRIGIAIGPRTWFGNHYGNNVSRNGIVSQNRFSGAFSYGMAITSATNFTVEGNSFFGNSSFIGARGPNCSASHTVPNPAPFIIQANTTTSISGLSNFVNISDGDSLPCVLPPNGGDFWPFGLNPSNSTTSTESGGLSPSARGGIIAAAVIVAVILCALAAWLIRRWRLRKGGKGPWLRKLKS